MNNKLLKLSFVALLVSCTNSQEGATSDGETRCTPGEKKACKCAEGAPGFTYCGRDHSWSMCDCSEKALLLADKGGAIQNAVFEPICSGDDYNSCKDSEDKKTYPCARIKYLDGAPVWLRYDLKTGKPVSCYRDNQNKLPAFYLDSECTTEPYGIALDADTNFQNKSPKRKGATLFSADVTNPPVIKESGYIFNANTEMCIPTSFEETHLYPLKPIPNSYLDLLKEPPYSFIEE